MKKILSLSWKVVCTQLAAIFLSFMFMMLFGALAEKIGITDICLVLLWICAIYSVGWNKGKKDSRTLPGVYPDVKSNFLAGLFCSGITFVLLILRVAAFHISAGGQIGNDTGFLVATDILYRLWNFPCVGYIQSGSLFAYSVPVFVPVIVYTLSYMIGLKRFSVAENILPNVIYKKKHR